MMKYWRLMVYFLWLSILQHVNCRVSDIKTIAIALNDSHVKFAIKAVCPNAHSP